MSAIYLDYAATTPVDPDVANAMIECLTAEGAFGNPSSTTHEYGRRASERVEAARAQVAALIGAAPHEIIFTSGATESNNLAILGVARANADRGQHIVTSRIEHKAVLDPCKRLEKEGFCVTYVSPDAAGRVTPEAVRAALRADTVLVSIMHVNNETGAINDIDAIGAECRARGIAFHTDAVQSAGRIELNVSARPVDFLSLTAHKIYGPKGAGALYVRKSSRPLLRAVTFGGGQEGGLRPGTLAVHQIVGLGLAAEIAARLRDSESRRLAPLRDRLWDGLRTLGGVHLNAEGAARIPAVLNVSFEGVEGESLVTGLDRLAVSTGSACNSASPEPSYVLRALGRSNLLAESSLRFSLGRPTTEVEIDHAVAQVQGVVKRLRALSPAAGPGTDGMESKGRVLTGESGSEARGTWVRFHMAVSDDTVKDARFQAFGCPHTLAVCEWITAQLPGRSRTDGIPGNPSEWVSAHDVPVEKLGRLLMVEDAARAAFERWS